MKIVSEILNKTFNTVAECEKAEAEYAKAQQVKAEAERKAKAAKEAKEKALQCARAQRAKEVEDAIKAVRDAENHYHEVLNAFVKDYGSFHYSYTGNGKDAIMPSFFSMLEPFEDIFFKF